MSETLITAEAATTTESQAASEQTAETTTTVADEGSKQQQQETSEGAKQETKPEGAPEKYDFKAPEGKDFDASVIEQFSEVAKELNLTNEAAQKVIDKIAPALAQKQEQGLQAARAEWTESSKSDKEFGGDKLSENLATAQKALDTFGTPELRTLLNESGLGNHPEIIRAFYRAGKAISEDRFVTGGQGRQQTGDARNLYSASKMNP